MGFVIAAWMAGLVGSLHCVGMCGPFALACGSHKLDPLAWHIGRIITYTALGGLAGAFGSLIPGPGWMGAAVSGALVIWFAAALAGMGSEPKISLPGLTRLASRLVVQRGAITRLSFGVANGLLPCGLVYAALSIPIASGNPITGAIAMAAFGFGTVPALTLLGLGAHRMGSRSLRTRRMLAFGVLLAGLWSIAVRQGIVGGGMERHIGAGAGIERE